jgi:hypothetical protein
MSLHYYIMCTEIKHSQWDHKDVTYKSTVLPLCDHSILHSPTVWGEGGVHDADIHSEDSKLFCAPGHASHVEDLVQQTDGGTPDYSLCHQVVFLAHHTLNSD